MATGHSLQRRVLWVSHSDLGSILDKATWIETSKSLSKRGVKVTLATPSSKRLTQIEGVQVVPFYLGKHPLVVNFVFTFLLLFYLPFSAILSRYDFVIVHAGVTSFGAIPLSFFPRSIRPTIVMDCRSPPILTFGIRGHAREIAFRFSFLIAKRLFDGITTITPMMKRDVCTDFDLPPSNVKVWPSGVSLTLFDPQECHNEGKLLRTKFGLEQRFVVFYHGSLTTIVSRGILDCLEAVEVLKEKHGDLVLFLLGSGDTSYLNRKIRELGIQNAVIIHGPVDYEKVPDYISMCDVAIVPLPNLNVWRHQCPLKLLEYLAMNKATIVTDIPANRYILGNSKLGILISDANSKEIAQAIVYAYDNRDKLPMWGEGGRDLVESNYSFRKVAESLEKCLVEFQSSV